MQVQILMRVTVPEDLDPRDFIEGLVDTIEDMTDHHVDYEAHTAPRGRALRKEGRPLAHSTPQSRVVRRQQPGTPEDPGA